MDDQSLGDDAKLASNCLSDLDIKSTHLSPIGRCYLRTLVDIADRLDINNVTEDGFLGGLLFFLSGEVHDVADTTLSCLATEELRTLLLHANTEGIVLDKYVELLSERLQHSESSTRTALTKDNLDEKLKPFIEKLHFYEEQHKNLEDQLHDVGFDESLSHESLVQRKTKLDELADNVQLLRSKLNFYSDLPMSMEEAEERLGRLKEESGQLDERLAQLGNTTSR